MLDTVDTGVFVDVAGGGEGVGGAVVKVGVGELAMVGGGRVGELAMVGGGWVAIGVGETCGTCVGVTEGTSISVGNGWFSTGGIGVMVKVGSKSATDVGSGGELSHGFSLSLFSGIVAPSPSSLGLSRTISLIISGLIECIST